VEENSDVHNTRHSWKKTGETQRKDKANESTVLLRDFSAHVGNDTGIWRSMIDQYDETVIHCNGMLLLQLCCNNALCIIITFFQQGDFHK